MSAPPPEIYEFGDFRMDVAERRLLRRDGTAVPLTPRVFDTLRYLVEHSGTLLDKERLMEAVWPDSIVEENNLSQNISMLRRIFGESPGSQRYIVTVPGRGYRFATEVRRAEKFSAPETNSDTRSTEPAVQHVGGQPESLVQPARGRAGPIAVVLAILLLGGTIFFLWRGRAPTRSPSAASAVSEKSVAVLPFEISATTSKTLFSWLACRMKFFPILP